jgi:7-cyano-7-deazaguanine synthase
MSLALQKGEVLTGLTFDYGQRAARPEREASERICRQLSVAHRVISLPWMAGASLSALLGEGRDVPRVHQSNLSDPAMSEQSARAVWVPNRNGIFINIAAALAESHGAGLVVTGFNREEAATFPDNTPAFVDAVNGALNYSTLTHVQVVSYTAEMDKGEILRAGLASGAPLEYVWSCYLGGPNMCGKCESCQRLRRAIAGTDAEEKIGNRFER